MKFQNSDGVLMEKMAGEGGGGNASSKWLDPAQNTSKWLDPAQNTSDWIDPGECGSITPEYAKVSNMHHTRVC